MQDAPFRALRLGEFGQARKPAQIGFQNGPNAGPAHLDHDFAAIVETRPMHLRNGSGRQGLGIEGREDFLGWRAEVFAELLMYGCPGSGRRAVLQLPEFGGPLGFE
jgi:hypothetical protein